MATETTQKSRPKEELASRTGGADTVPGLPGFLRLDAARIRSDARPFLGQRADRLERQRLALGPDG